jgi:hypothetical protein
MSNTSDEKLFASPHKDEKSSVKDNTLANVGEKLQKCMVSNFSNHYKLIIPFSFLFVVGSLLLAIGCMIATHYFHTDIGIGILLILLGLFIQMLTAVFITYACCTTKKNTTSVITSVSSLSSAQYGELTLNTTNSDPHSATIIKLDNTELDG